MNRKRFPELAAQAQQGDQTALEQLLVQVYTPVSYQCRKLLQNDQAAEALTKEILLTVRRQLPGLKDPERFDVWLNNLVAKLCMGALERETPDQKPPRKKLEIPGEHLDQRETAMVVDQILDALPQETRLCLVLYCCGQIPVKRIAQLTGLEEPQVETHLKRATSLINGGLKKLSRQGVRIASVTSLPEILQLAMDTPRNPKAAAAMVNSVLGKKPPKAAPVPPRKPRTRGLWIAVAVCAGLLLLLAGTAFALERNRHEAPEETTAVTETTQVPTEETSVPTTVATTAATTMETTQETTVPTTVAETVPETTQAPTQPVTEAKPAPVPQPSQGGQAASGTGTSGSTGSGSGTASGGSTASGTGGTTASNGSHVHSYQDAGPIGVISAGCESPGSRLKICFVCGDKVRYVDEAGLPPTGHSYSTSVKAPTTTREGYTVHTCTRCGHNYTDNYVPKLPEETQPPATQAPAATSPAEIPVETPAAE